MVEISSCSGSQRSMEAKADDFLDHYNVNFDGINTLLTKKIHLFLEKNCTLLKAEVIEITFQGITRLSHNE